MTTPSHPNEMAAEHFARKVTARLSQGSAELPYVVTERLRASRMQALGARKRVGSPLHALHTENASSIAGAYTDGTLAMGQHPGQDNTPLWVRRLLTALPLLALAAGLAFIGVEHDSRITVDVADVDAALLTSELPPAAYMDAGFQQYLQSTVTDTP